MMNKIITSYCSIRNNEIFLNGKIDFLGGKDISLEVFLNQIYKEKKIVYPKFFKMDNLCKIAFLTVELLGIGKKLNGVNNAEIGIVISNSYSSLDTDTNYNESIKDRNNYFPSPAIFVYTLPNIMIGEICIRHKLVGESAFFVSREFNPKIFIAYINHLFDSGRVQSCITGWVDIYQNKYESILSLIEKTNTNENKNIFNESTLIKLYKGEIN